MITVAIINQKGGVGKTTTAINLSAQAALKSKTLVIDCDKQANLSYNFGVTDPNTTIRDALLGDRYELVPVRKNLDLLPSSRDLIGVETILNEKFNRESLLKKSLSEVRDNYEYCFIDCPPEIGLITVNALTCADYVILPVKASQFSLEGISVMLEFLTQVRHAMNPNLDVLGILLTQYDERLNVSKNIVKKIKENGWDIAMFDTKIRQNTAIEQSQYEQKTIFEYDKNANGAKDYISLGKEILTKVNLKTT